MSKVIEKFGEAVGRQRVQFAALCVADKVKRHFYLSSQHNIDGYKTEVGKLSSHSKGSRNILIGLNVCERVSEMEDLKLKTEMKNLLDLGFRHSNDRFALESKKGIPNYSLYR